MLTLNLVGSTVVFALAAWYYYWPNRRDYSRRAVLVPILLLHGLRHLGLMFLTPGATYPGLPAQFAYPAALGDFLAATLAIVAFASVVTGRTTMAPVWIFNIVGVVDLLVAITLATAYDAGAFMGAAYWIPAFWVPALLVTHAITFVVLVQFRPIAEHSPPNAVQRS